MKKNSKQQRRGRGVGIDGDGNLDKQPGAPHPALSPKGGEGEEHLQRGRNATERLLAIHQLISARKFPNTFRLAAEFEVSQKTVKRDVEWMKVHWDLPTDYDRKRPSYFAL